MKSVFGSVMWMGRATVFLIGLSVILAVVFAATSMAFAANGKPFVLGKNNAAKAVSTLTKQGPGPALRLLMRPGQPPMAVNSKVRVNNLNADKVDGKDTGGLSRVAQMETQATTPIPSNDRTTYGQPLSITAPAPGFVRVNGNVTFVNTGCTAACEYSGYVRHINTDDYSIPAEDGAGSSGSYGDVSLDVVFPVDAGANTFDIQLGRSGGARGTLTAEYTP